ncbi:hypothetical protein [Pseudanabaena sp. Chao 1811]|uniref:hypothetical protein n=1 Tax=Pseudanabaena sp. Chao 1811 TaxID=2963092 RepID=UPI0022F39BA0|nr:hypothetical protein [Pseudanabaena sp. Chao 1811]
MLELILIFQILVAQIPTISSKSLAYIANSRFDSNIAFSVTKRDLNIYKYIYNKENEPHFNDEKLGYIHDNRRSFRICEENTGNEVNAVSDKLLEFRAKSSKVYKVDSHKHILEFTCYPGAYNVYKEFLLYSIANNEIEIKPLLLIVNNGEKLNSNGQIQQVWKYSKGIRGLPTFDTDSLTLKVSTVRNLAGYEAEYKFEEDQFKLLKYTILTLKFTSDKSKVPAGRISESKVVYP